MCALTACGRFGYDAAPREIGPDAASPIGGGGGSAGIAGAGGSGSGGLAGSAGSAGAGGSPDQGGSSSLGGSGGAAGGAGGSSGGTGPLASCADGQRNGDEAGIDCGGTGGCVPCACSFGAAERLGNPNYAGNQIWGSTLSIDGLTMYVAFVVPGGSEQIGVTTRPDRGNSFGLANPLPAPVTQSVEGTPHLSLDGLSLYFNSTRPGGAGNRDLYVAQRDDASSEFDSVIRLGETNSSATDHLPWVSSDQLVLYYTTDRAGNFDVWAAEREQRGEPFGAGAPVVELNSSVADNGATLTQDLLSIIISSQRPGGEGSWDLYQAVRANRDAPFSTPEPLDGLNTASSEADPSLTPDGQELFFVSNRNGGAVEIWRSLRSCP